MENRIVSVSSTGGFFAQPTGAVYSATTFAARALSEGLRKESNDARGAGIDPGVVTSELANAISGASARETRAPASGRSPVEEARSSAIGRAIRTAIEQPGDVDVNEIVVRSPATRAR